jgi:ectoine hydroxylase-related dioxygenase (phytanoyl-CoA dioxygenase family)
MLTAWIPFQDCPAETGPVMYVDRSHGWSGTSDMRTYRLKDLSELERQFPDKEPMAKVPMTLRKGEVSFHVSRLIHGSEPNRGHEPRVALAVHMQDTSNRYRVYLNEKGVPWHIFIDDLARKLEDGSPDYTDPNVFPVLWKEDNSV